MTALTDCDIFPWMILFFFVKLWLLPFFSSEIAPDDDEDTGISKMDVIQLCRLLNSDDLCVDSEESVYACINYWLQSCNGC